MDSHDEHCLEDHCLDHFMTIHLHPSLNIQMSICLRASTVIIYKNIARFQAIKTSNYLDNFTLYFRIFSHRFLFYY